MNKLIFLLMAVSLGTYTARGQQEAWDKWDKAVIEKANTAKSISYYTEEEKKVVLLINLARLDGELFASSFLDNYIQTGKTKTNSYVKSLYKDLKPVKNLPLLVPKNDLSEIADGHASKSGKTGHVGHKDMQKRFKAVFGNPYYTIAENCSYGYDQALDIVLTLLIDSGIPSLGHRKNILNASFNAIGVATRPHKDYGYNCVIDFGGN